MEFLPCNGQKQSRLEHYRKRMELHKDQLTNDPRGLPIDKDDLVSRVLEEWQRIPQNFIRKVYASIPRRLPAVISLRGYPTKY